MRKVLFNGIAGIYVVAVVWMLILIVKTAFFPTQGGPPTSMSRSDQLMLQALILAAISLGGAGLFFLLARLHVL